MRIEYKYIETLQGTMLIACKTEGLSGLWFEHQRHFPSLVNWHPVQSHPWLDQCEAEIQAYFAGRLRVFTTPLSAAAGTEFQNAVWQALCAIPYGQTMSYADLAKAVNRPTAVRAVGAAVGKNPWSIVVPCHRIVGSDGSLTGYAGGVQRKRSLLELELAGVATHLPPDVQGTLAFF